MKLMKNNLKRFLSVLAAFVMIFAAIPAMEAKADLVSPEVNGNEVTFNYYAPDADEVLLAGDMTNWQDGAKAMTKEGGVFTITLTLDKGTYAYKFIADGTWVADPSNPNTKDDGYNGFNSVVEVTAGEAPKVAESPVVDGNKVTFNYINANAKEVFLAGTMNEWATDATPMTKDGDTFSVTLTLEAGTHEYKFVVDGGWINDPANAEKADNGNNVVTVAGGETTDTPSDDTTGDTPSDDTNDDAAADDGKNTYTIYGYSSNEKRNTIEAAAVWMWDLANGGEGQEVLFTETEEIDGKTYLKAVVEVNATTEMGLILKSKGAWDWKGKDTDLVFSNPDKKDATIFLVDGQGEVFTSVEDIPAEEEKAPVEQNTENKEDNKDKTANKKKDAMDPGTVAWIVVAIVVAATAVIAFVVVKKLTANLPEAVAEEVVEEVAEETAEETNEEV